jgi:hypothetical protein
MAGRDGRTRVLGRPRPARELLVPLKAAPREVDYQPQDILCAGGRAGARLWIRIDVGQLGVNRIGMSR